MGKLRGWKVMCGYCFRIVIFRGPSCGRCRTETSDLLKRMFGS